MSLRIAFDIDGVFADLESSYRRVVQTLFGDTLPAAAPPDAVEPGDDPAADTDIEPVHPPGITLSNWQESEAWREIEEAENFWASLPPHEPGILKRVQELAERHRWEIFFVTQPPILPEGPCSARPSDG
ncbi:MAG: hypothetical protein QGG24_02685 [Vicinamibacterales bacterium]|jgi:phosphoglycolate phosphatase-like HAD superfamily hydrolase|nr:hypothetical protein [Acidobacteriota bacterium]MDP7294205.1 hypothetical protein [Vicinamibacterales bacterium]MDP7473116.1 hypothetical protein [Vicinamibacterales bacterium]MDP7672730.1 hypothetical protein [Vicinamibacterales bacterium]HJO38327.1 hypothetical protein [Vicinamibacterales bacterium]|tara:strand:- start:337 stop:723 length:387 start_codon:yes stop_codon:yes gene_type:complete